MHYPRVRQRFSALGKLNRAVQLSVVACTEHNP